MPRNLRITWTHGVPSEVVITEDGKETSYPSIPMALQASGLTKTGQEMAKDILSHIGDTLTPYQGSYTEEAALPEPEKFEIPRPVSLEQMRRAEEAFRTRKKQWEKEKMKEIRTPEQAWKRLEDLFKGRVPEAAIEVPKMAPLDESLGLKEWKWEYVPRPQPKRKGPMDEFLGLALIFGAIGLGAYGLGKATRREEG